MLSPGHQLMAHAQRWPCAHARAPGRCRGQGRASGRMGESSLGMVMVSSPFSSLALIPASRAHCVSCQARRSRIHDANQMTGYGLLPTASTLAKPWQLQRRCSSDDMRSISDLAWSMAWGSCAWAAPRVQRDRHTATATPCCSKPRKQMRALQDKTI